MHHPTCWQRLFLILVCCAFFPACECVGQSAGGLDAGPQLIVLGVAQDAGYPQAGCNRTCCERGWNDSENRRFPVCLGIVDPESRERWMIECTPDFKHQLRALDEFQPPREGLGLDGLLITHAHVGHYAGLIHLGREVIGADALPVFVMPRMAGFLERSGPWNQLLSLNNIELRPLADHRKLRLNARVSVTPLLVPHRDEYSETVGFRIEGPNRSALFLPDIDKWSAWETAIEKEIAKVDVALLDATFFDGSELPGRDMSKIPHPFVVETLARFKDLPTSERAKVHLLHFNHTNPLLDDSSAAAKRVRKEGLKLAQQLQTFEL